MKKLSIVPIALVGLGVMTLSAPAQAIVEFDQNVTPDVIFGSGNINGSFTTDRNNGIELGLRGKLRHDATGQPQNIFSSNGDGTYSFQAIVAPTQAFPTAEWSFEWSVNTDMLDPVAINLDELTYVLGLDSDPGPGTSFTTFDPISAPYVGQDHAFGNNSTTNGGGTKPVNEATFLALLAANNVAQNSWKPHWFIPGFDPTVSGTYSIYLEAYGSAVLLARTEIQILTVGPVFVEVAGGIDNGSFELPDRGSCGFAPINTGLYDWTIAGTVDHICQYWTAAEGDQSLDMSGGNSGSVTQNLGALDEGHPYRVTFKMAGNNDGGSTVKSLNVAVGGAPVTYTFDVTGTNNTNMGWTEKTFEFIVGAGAVNLTFASLETNAYGPALDDVKLFRGNSAPIANDDEFTVNEDTQLPGSVLIDNSHGPDSDADGDALTAILDTDAGHGLLILSPDGSFTYDPYLNYCGADSFTYKVSDGDVDSTLATVSITVTCVNDDPTANDDSGAGFTTDEESSFTTGNVLDNDTDPDVSDVLSVGAFDAVGTAGGSVSSNGDGTFGYDPNGQFEYLGTGESANDTFTYTISDGNGGSDIATVTIVVTGVNDASVMVSVSQASQLADYSDHIGHVTITATDVDSPTSGGNLTLSQTGAPSDIPNPSLVSTAICSELDDGQTCTWTMAGQVEVAAAEFDIDFTANDGEDDSACSGVTGICRHELTVLEEKATVLLASDNGTAVQVETAGGASGEIKLMFSAWEDGGTDTAHIGSPDFGDLNNMVPVMSLVPVGPGGPVDGICQFIGPLPAYPGSGYGEEALFECTFDEVPVNTYEVVASVGGGYYMGSDDGVLVVFDPSLGFTTGGGWFYWPGTADPELLACGEEGYPGDKTNFGFNMKYNKRRTNIQGSLLMMRHTVDANCEDAGKYRVKSNMLDGLSIGEGTDDDGAYGWAVFSGKSVFNEPLLEGDGNHPFVVYVDDHTDEGGNQDPADEFWIQVKDGDGNVVLETNGPDSDPAGENGQDGDDVPIENGNIIVPHSSNGGGKP